MAEEEPKKEENISPVEDALTKAEALAARIEEANKKSEDILARAILSGRATGGAIREELSDEDKKKAATMEFWKGSEIEKALKKHG